MTIPGIGPITATAITALVPAAEQFRTGRGFAAWLGLTPLQKSTGGKQKLGAVSKRRANYPPLADPRGQRSDPTGLSPWRACWVMVGTRKPKMLVTVDLANKMARVVWALLVKGGVYKAAAASS